MAIGAAVVEFLLFTVIAVVRRRLQPSPPPAWARITGLIAAGVLVFASYEGGDVVYHGASGIEPKLLAPELRERQEKKQGGSSGPSHAGWHFTSIASAWGWASPVPRRPE